MTRRRAETPAGRQEAAGFPAYNLGIALSAGRSARRGAPAARQSRRGRCRRRRDRGDPRQVEPGARHAAVRVRPSSRARRARSTASGSRGRSRTRRCCAPAGPRSRPSTSTVRSCRGTSSRGASPPMPPSRKRCWRCPMRTASLRCTAARRCCTARRSSRTSDERDKLDASIDSIRDGKFLKALVREEIRQDKDWVIRLRILPETPETYYLMELMASHDFQTALQNYLDLEDLRCVSSCWKSSFDAFEDIIRLRRAYYEPLLPGLDAQFRELDSRCRLRLEQRKHPRRTAAGHADCAAAGASRDCGRTAADDPARTRSSSASTQVRRPDAAICSLGSAACAGSSPGISRRNTTSG